MKYTMVMPKNTIFDYNNLQEALKDLAEWSIMNVNCELYENGKQIAFSENGHLFTSLKLNIA